MQGRQRGGHLFHLLQTGANDVHHVHRVLRRATDIRLQVQNIELIIGQYGGNPGNYARLIGTMHTDLHIGIDVVMQVTVDCIDMKM